MNSIIKEFLEQNEMFEAETKRFFIQRKNLFEKKIATELTYSFLDEMSVLGFEFVYSSVNDSMILLYENQSTGFEITQDGDNVFSIFCRSENIKICFNKNQTLKALWQVLGLKFGSVDAKQLRQKHENIQTK